MVVAGDLVLLVVVSGGAVVAVSPHKGVVVVAPLLLLWLLAFDKRCRNDMPIRRWTQI